MAIEKDLYTYFENKNKIPSTRREVAKLDAQITQLIDKIKFHRDFQTGESIQELQRLRTEKGDAENRIINMEKEQLDIENKIAGELSEFDNVPIEFKVSKYTNTYAMVTVKDNTAKIGTPYSRSY